MNLIIEYILAANTPGFTTVGGIGLPPVRAFMDDLNLMAGSVPDARTLLDRACVALKWAGMEFRADKSRSIVLKQGKSLRTTPFEIPNGDCIETIPSVQNKPIKFLGRVINGHLNDRKSIDELKEKLESGLTAIDRSKLSGPSKVWILSNLMIPCFRWPLTI